MLLKPRPRLMETLKEFEAFRREQESWWFVARRKLLHDTLARALYGKNEARVLDLGGAAQLEGADFSIRVLNAHWSFPVLAFNQIQGARNQICTRMDELGLASNTFDAIVSGDLLQFAPDDLAVIRELRRVLKDGGLLCLTVPAYDFLWGEEDEARGHQRRYSASLLRRKLTTCGFEIHRVSYFVAGGFPPAALDRLGRNIFHKSFVPRVHSSHVPRVVNSTLITLLDCERQLMRYINLPFGTRLVCWARKPALVAERVTVPAWERQWAAHPLPQGTT